MGVQTSAGSNLRISAAQPATFDETGYATLFPGVPTASDPIIGEITDLGEFGREYNAVTHNPVGSRGTQKFKGSFNEGSMTLQLGLDADDAGQVLAMSASNSDADHSFALALQDGTMFYFQAKVMSFKIGVGSVDSVTSATISVEITTNSAGVGIIGPV